MDKIEDRAVDIAKAYEKKHKRTVVDFQRGKKGFRGFDLLSFSKDRKDVRSIEVKGTQINNTGNIHIPILFDTGFTRNKKLVATHLYVAVFKNGRKADFVKLLVFTASEIKPEYVNEERHFRIRMPRHIIAEKMASKITE